jgi:hypothetical protein
MVKVETGLRAPHTQTHRAEAARAPTHLHVSHVRALEHVRLEHLTQRRPQLAAAREEGEVRERAPKVPLEVRHGALAPKHRRHREVHDAAAAAAAATPTPTTNCGVAVLRQPVHSSSSSSSGSSSCRCCRQRASQSVALLTTKHVLRTDEHDTAERSRHATAAAAVAAAAATAARIIGRRRATATADGRPRGKKIIQVIHTGDADAATARAVVRPRAAPAAVL